MDVGAELRQRAGGQAIAACSFQTADGVRVAGVARISDARLAEMGQVTPLPRAPEVCVEIMSPSNSWATMHIKAGLYLEAGADEVWIQTLDGQRTVIKPPKG